MFVFFVRAEVCVLVCVCNLNDKSIAWAARAATGEKQMNVKSKTGGGRKEVGGWERGKRIHALWRMDRAGG